MHTIEDLVRQGRYAEAAARLDAEPPSLARDVSRARLLWRTGEFARARTLAEQILPAASGQPEEAEVLAVLTSVALAERDPERALALADAAILRYQQSGRPDARLRMQGLRAKALKMAGDPAGAERAVMAAVAEAEQGPPAALALILLDASTVLRTSRDPEAALQPLHRAIALLDRDATLLGDALMMLGGACAELGRLDEAESHLERALALTEAQGVPERRCTAANALGEVARGRGDLARAAELYRFALDGYRALGSPEAAYPLLNLALIRLSEQDWQGAADLVAAPFQPALELPFRALRIGAASGLGRWEHVSAELAAFERVWRARPRSDTDSARCLDLAAEQAAEAGETAIAVRCRALTLGHWLRLRDEPAAGRARHALRELARRGEPVPLGPFRLVGRLGAGGAGTVWEAVHAESDHPVAIKILSRADQRGALWREARATAGLHHPGIVRVVDYGEVGEVAAAMTGGALSAGQPWVALELLRGGTLTARCGRTPWPECRAILLGLLDALAHAHARELVHLDLKPDNVLATADGRWKLADFGLARAFGEAVPRAGTPAYASPEQIRDGQGAAGPAADLYAIGGLAWALVSGGPPFGVRDAATALLHAQLYREPPELEPAVPVPAGFEAWCRVLLAKSPAHRFASAYAAAEALRRLGSASGEGRAAASPSAAATTYDFDGAPFDEPALDTPTRAATRRVGDEPLGARLFTLRRPPLRGRDAELALLWRALEAVREDGRARLVEVVGAAGLGRTALIEGFLFATREAGETIVTALDDPEARPSLPSSPALVIASRRSDRRPLGGDLVLTLLPLEPAAIAQLVQDRLLAAPELVHAVVATASGSPRFAVDLVAGWIAAESLAWTPAGYRPTRAVAAPASALAAAHAHLDALLGDLGEAGARAAELAAVFGAEVPEGPWIAACRAAARLLPPPGLIERLEVAGVLVPVGAGWRFALSDVRAALIERAAAGERLARWHRACASALDPAAEPGRVGLHLVAAGEERAGLSLLLDAAERAPDRAPGVIDAARRAAWACGLSPSDPLAVRLAALDGAP